MLAEAINLTLFGMGFVFLFLIILVTVIKIMAMILNRPSPNNDQVHHTKSLFTRQVNEIDDDVKLAIEQAIREHRGA